MKDERTGKPARPPSVFRGVLIRLGKPVFRQSQALRRDGRRTSRLAVLRLSDFGEGVFRELGWEVAENEWQRLIDDHRGEDLPLHTAGLQGHAALATFTSRQRRLMVLECKGLRIGGRATDLQSLTNVATSPTPDELWAEKWMVR